MADTEEQASTEATADAPQKVALIDDHGVRIEVEAQHAYVLEGLGWVRADAAEQADSDEDDPGDEDGDPSQDEHGEGQKQEDQPPPKRGRRGGS